MATRIIGKVAFRPRGNWDALVSDYERLDTVVEDNVMYIALQNVPAGTLVSDSTYWQRSISGSGSSSQLDTAMSDTSTNGVQNRVIKAYVDEQAARIDSLTTDVSAKASTEYVNGELDKKVDKEDGKVLSSNDYTNEDKTLVGTIEGKADNSKNGAIELINKLDAGSSIPADDDYFVAQYANGSSSGDNRYSRRKFSALWNYIKSKFADDSDITAKIETDVSSMFAVEKVTAPTTITLADGDTTTITFETAKEGYHILGIVGFWCYSSYVDVTRVYSNYDTQKTGMTIRNQSGASREVRNTTYVNVLYVKDSATGRSIEAPDDTSRK